MNRTLLLLFAVLALPASAQDWTTVPVGTTNDLHALLQAGSGFRGYVAGDDGFVASSQDNLTWAPTDVGTAADLLSLLQPAEGQVWMSGQAGVVRVGNAISGWNGRNVPDAGESYVLSTQSSGEAIAYGSGGSIWKTINFGQTWTLEHSAGAALHDGWGGTAAFGLAVGSGGTILKTTDSGQTWTPRPSGTTADLYAVVESGTGQFFVVGEDGEALYSSDAGETWSPRLSGTTRTLRAVASWGNSVIVAVGDQGAMVRTGFQGETWCRLDPGVTADLFDVKVDGLTLIQAVGEGGLFRRTTTGGGACTAAVDAEITRVGTSDIPPSGGALTFRVTLTNPTPESQTFEAWVDARLPNGSPFGPVLGPQTVTLAPGQTVGPITFTRSVPAQAPSGQYTVRLRVGAYPEGFLHDESTFTFVKSASAQGGEGAASAAAMTPADWGSGGASFLSGTEDAEAARDALRLVAYPNPSEGRTTLRVTLPTAGRVRLAIYDVLGREVTVVVDEELAAGAHVAAFDGATLPAGPYLVRLTAGGAVLTGRLTLVR